MGLDDLTTQYRRPIAYANITALCTTRNNINTLSVYRLLTDSKAVVVVVPDAVAAVGNTYAYY